jgi:hypothetical protein
MYSQLYLSILIFMFYTSQLSSTTASVDQWASFYKACVFDPTESPHMVKSKLLYRDAQNYSSSCFIILLTPPVPRGRIRSIMSQSQVHTQEDGSRLVLRYEQVPETSYERKHTPTTPRAQKLNYRALKSIGLSS